MFTAASADAIAAAARGYCATSSDPAATVSSPAARLNELTMIVFEADQLFISSPHDATNPAQF